jgi:flagellar protein FliJ
VKGYRFRLEPVLRVRRLQEERARAALAMARRAEQDAQAETGRRRGLMAAARDAGLPDGSRLQWAAARDRQDRLAQAILVSQMAEAHAADLAAGNMAHWEEAALALRTLERLDERSREVWNEEQRRNEQRDLDELTSARAARTVKER